MSLLNPLSNSPWHQPACLDRSHRELLQPVPELGRVCAFNHYLRHRVVRR